MGTARITHVIAVGCEADVAPVLVLLDRQVLSPPVLLQLPVGVRDGRRPSSSGWSTAGMYCRVDILRLIKPERRDVGVGEVVGGRASDGNRIAQDCRGGQGIVLSGDETRILEQGDYVGRPSSSVV